MLEVVISHKGQPFNSSTPLLNTDTHFKLRRGRNHNLIKYKTQNLFKEMYLTVLVPYSGVAQRDSTWKLGYTCVHDFTEPTGLIAYGCGQKREGIWGHTYTYS